MRDPRRPEGDERTRAYRLANAVSYFLNPLIFPPVGFTLIAAHFRAGAGEILATLGVSLVFFCLIPLLYVVGLIRAGRVESLEIRDRNSRLGPLLVGIASYALGALVLSYIVDGPALPLIVAFAALFPINTAIILLINLRWKISLHMTSLAGFVSVLLFTALTVWRDLPAGLETALTIATVGPLLPLIPLLMWARVRVGAHTRGQVVAGALFGLIAPLVELYVIVYRVLDLA